MASTHNLVTCKLILSAEMARQTELRASDWLIGGIEPMQYVVGVTGARFSMGLEPVLRATMTGLATHTISDLESPAPLVAGNIVSVTIEANLGRSGTGQPQLFRYAPALVGL
jgi:hypothetical protein